MVSQHKASVWLDTTKSNWKIWFFGGTLDELILSLFPSITVCSILYCAVPKEVKHLMKFLYRSLLWPNPSILLTTCWSTAVSYYSSIFNCPILPWEPDPGIAGWPCTCHLVPGHLKTGGAAAQMCTLNCPFAVRIIIITKVIQLCVTNCHTHFVQQV